MAKNSDDPITPVEIVEELTEDELADLQRLERKVERAATNLTRDTLQRQGSSHC